MNANKGGLAPGLFLVATPIGNARDITLRTLDLLQAADVLAAEDTRSLRRLMEIHGICLGDRPLVAYHEHNAEKACARIVTAIEAGQSVVYASEAGTPMISDPGYELVRAAREADLPVTSAPGPSAVITALTLAALPTDRFLFAGFLPNTSAARKKAMREVMAVPATMAFYESPKRLAAMLRDAAEVFGATRQAAVCREITKKFEETRRGTLQDLADHYETSPPKGEIVVLIDRGGEEDQSGVDIEAELQKALETMSVRDAADYISVKFGQKRRPVYQMAMRMSDKE